MPSQSLEVADIFRAHGAAWRAANAPSHHLQANDCQAMRHISLNQFKVISAIERCRTAALGGHVARCADCAQEHIAYNSCRNRHCSKCQAGAAKAWLAAREAELLPVRYFHLVFTLPKQIADIAHQNKREIYNLLMRASADTVIKIAADPKHLGARVGITSVLHTWGSAMTHHPHVHMIVPPSRDLALQDPAGQWGEGFRRMAQNGSPAARTSSCPYVCCRTCTGGSFWKGWPSCMVPGNCISSAITWTSSTRPFSTISSNLCTKSTGSFTLKNPSPGPKPYWHTYRATPTGSPFPTAD
jgi:hypothetical protein